MTVTTHWFVITTVIAAVLASIAIWSPRSVKMKVLALICAAAFLPMGYISLNDILSRPKPMALETVHKQIEQVQVVSSLMKEDVAIYLWLQIPDIEEPRSYKLPWSDELAKELHQAQQNAEKSGTEVKMKKPFERTEDNQATVFYAEPPPPPPTKQTTPDNPILFKAENSEE